MQVRLRQVIRRQHKALSTEENYVFWLRRYMAAVHQMPGTLASEKKLEQFLTELACRHHVSASTQNQALNAILFFYKHVLEHPIKNVDALRATRPAHMRRAPSIQETLLLLQSITNVGQYPSLGVRSPSEILEAARVPGIVGPSVTDQPFH